MTTIARKLVNLVKQDAIILDYKNLELIACEKDQDYINETTAYIFEDGSALIVDNWSNRLKVVTNYGRNVDHEQL